MKNNGLEEAGITIARRTVNNFRYADDTTLMEESKAQNSPSQAPTVCEP